MTPAILINLLLQVCDATVGRQLDQDGNLKQWWSEEVVTRFKNSAQCIIDQYGNYTVAEVDLKVCSSTYAEYQ